MSPGPYETEGGGETKKWEERNFASLILDLDIDIDIDIDIDMCIFL